MIYDELIDIIKDNFLIPSYYADGYYRNTIQWCKTDMFHNLNGPARIGYYQNGYKRCNQMWKNNKLHSLNGPAIIYFCENGNKQRKERWENGKFIQELKDE